MKNFIIAFRGLRDGVHYFNWHVDTSFFENDDFDQLDFADVNISVVLRKKERIMEFDFNFEGSVTHVCDRCLLPVTLSISRKEHLIAQETYKKEISFDENLIYYNENENEIDFNFFIREIIFLSLPMKIVHPEGECDPEMEKIIQSLKVRDELPLFHQISKRNG
ncbi:MAG: DUF177 domain-containing protein [Bacteroidales bacterium]|nr:DUF177 domain-containing protein [Bacteroidales bacterium]